MRVGQKRELLVVSECPRRNKISSLSTKELQIKWNKTTQYNWKIITAWNQFNLQSFINYHTFMYLGEETMLTIHKTNIISSDFIPYCRYRAIDI